MYFQAAQKTGIPRFVSMWSNSQACVIDSVPRWQAEKAIMKLLLGWEKYTTEM